MIWWQKRRELYLYGSAHRVLLYPYFSQISTAQYVTTSRILIQKSFPISQYMLIMIHLAMLKDKNLSWNAFTLLWEMRTVTELKARFKNTSTAVQRGNARLNARYQFNLQSYLFVAFWFMHCSALRICAKLWICATITEMSYNSNPTKRICRSNNILEYVRRMRRHS